MELKLESRVLDVTQRRVRDVKEEEEEETQQGNLTFPSPATTGQTNFKV